MLLQKQVNGIRTRKSEPAFLVFLKGTDFWNEHKILSHNGELTLQYNVFRSEGSLHGNQKWTDSCFSPKNGATLSNDLKHLFQNRPANTTNLVIRADGKVLKAHKDVVCARSPVFSAMMSNNMNEKLCNVINIEEIDFKTINSFLTREHLNAVRDGRTRTVCKQQPRNIASPCMLETTGL
ncbi:hypothetical protein AVEN_64739-1 [Araneus ventricosus]|uniref:BTB domain-containing protein n=1 Tax=Araneus ventricosus TaxID=182803 RepID=A0A4Y2UCR2_ARAVE|nr:hypothetical protein AVEN_64739-1 [Araneus ventricosus]